MGFLRKVGRKIKKGVKKLFSSKIGAFLGSMAIGMILGPAMSNVFGGIKGALGFGTKQAVGEAATAVATEGVTAAATEAAVGETVSKVAGEDLLTSTLTEQAAKQEASKAITSESLNKVLETSITPVEKAANLTSKFAEGTLNGDIPLKVNLNVTDALNDVNNFLETGQIIQPEIAQIQPKINIKTEALTGALESAKAGIKGIDTRSLTDIPFGELGTGQKIAKAGVETLEYLTPDASSIGEFAADTSKDILGALAVSSVMGGDEVQRGTGLVASQPLMVGAQAGYVQDIAPQFMTASNMTRVPSFQELSQQTMYGNGSPQFIGQIYQPLVGA